MTIGERIKDLRVNRLGMTLDGFGEKIGLKRSGLSLVESGKRGITDQTILSICREFGVNEEWLRSGSGECFVTVAKNEQIRSFIDKILADEPEGPKTRLIEALAGLDERGWDTLVKLAQKMVEEKEEEPEEAAPLPPAPTDSSDLTPEEKEIIRQHRERRRQMDA